jgi:hypothetical protein
MGIRALGALLLGGVAATHILDLPDKLAEAHYMAALFCGLIVASIALAALLLTGRAIHFAWGAAAGVSVAAIAGYVLSRSVGLPELADHVGRWADPMGIAALVCEAGLVALAVRARAGAAGRAVRVARLRVAAE